MSIYLSLVGLALSSSKYSCWNSLLRAFLSRYKFILMESPVMVERDHVSITVAWPKTLADSVSAYELQMMTSLPNVPEPSEWVSLSSSLKSTSIRKKNLLPEIGYSFRVRCLASDTSTWSEFTVPSEQYFVLPDNFRMMESPTMNNKDGISVTIQWQEVPGATGYALKYRQESDRVASNTTGSVFNFNTTGPIWTKIDSVVRGTKVRKKGLVPGVSYYFAIMPVEFAENGEQQEESADRSGHWAYSSSSAPMRVATLSTFLQNLFPVSLLTKNNGVGTNTTKKDTSELLAGKCVAVYFSAHWCGPCRQFTPRLLDLYGQCKAQGKQFEVVFCSADNSEEEFMDYYSSMSWPAIEYNDDKRESLMGTFKVSGIPRLCVLAASGRIIVDNAAGGTALNTATVDQWVRTSESMK